MLYCRYVIVSGCHYVTDAMMSLCNGCKVVAIVSDVVVPLCKLCYVATM